MNKASKDKVAQDAVVVESFAHLAALLEKHRRLAEAANALPSQIAAAQAAAEAARKATVDVDLDLIGDIDLTDTTRGAFEARADELTHDAIVAEATVKRLEARLPAVEEALEALDAEIEMEISIVQNDADALISELAAACEPELLAATGHLTPVVARITAILECVSRSHAGSAAFKPYIPALNHHPVYVGDEEYSRAPNLLKLDDAAMSAARAEVGDAVKPVRDALALARGWKRYVPHAKRPQPYVRKGVHVEFSGAPPIREVEIIKR